MSARFSTAALVLGLLAGWPGPARADAPNERALAVKLTLAHAELEQAQIEQALEHELGVPVSTADAASARIEITVSGRHAVVRYLSAGAAPVTRRIDLPPNKDRASEAIAFLVGNLARDQATELLEGLRPHADARGEPALPAGEAAASADAPAAADAAAATDAPGAQKPAEPAKPAEAPPPAKAPAKLPPAKAPAEPALRLEPTLVNLSFYDPLTLLPNTRQRAVALELGFAYSRVGAIEGVGFTLGYLRLEHASHGAALGVGLLRTQALDGAGASAFVSLGSGALHGAEAAGLVTLRAGPVQGAQAAGLVTTSGALEGAQVAGLYSYAQSLEGMQIAGLAAYAQRVQGFQLAGLSTLSGRVEGAQLGMVDVASDVDGAQLGLVNVSRKVRGLQIGFVNVAKELHGGALGFVNLAGNGRVQPSLWISGPVVSQNVGVKFLTDYTYTLIGAGSTSSGDRFRYEAGLGAHLPLGAFYGELGASYAEALSRVSDKLHTDRRELRPRVTVGVRLLPWLEPFAGGGVVTRVTGSGSDVGGEYFAGLSFL